MLQNSSRHSEGKTLRRDCPSHSSDIVYDITSELDLFKGLSFETISSTGANASVIHYAPDEHTSAVIDKAQIYLCDSGGQFLDGTTE